MNQPLDVLIVNRVLGTRDEPRFADRPVEWVAVAWPDASKHRLRRRSANGADVLINVARGSFLRHDDVLSDLGDRVLVVERTEEVVLVVRPGSLGEAVRIGHAYGNQHVPIEITGGEVVVPVTTSESIASSTARTLGVEHVLQRRRPFATEPPSHGHGHGHGHG